MKTNWVTENAATADCFIDVGDSIHTAGINIPEWCHIIQCHGDTPEQAILLRDLILKALLAYEYPLE